MTIMKTSGEKSSKAESGDIKRPHNLSPDGRFFGDTIRHIPKPSNL